MSLSGKTLVAGVVGQPIAHSMSPVLHNAWIAAAGLDAVYVPLAVTEAGFPSLIAGLRGSSVRGLNVTLPFKLLALDAADQVSVRAELAGAANVLTFKPNGQILADNTDGLGLLAAFAEQAPGFDPKAGPVVLLGAGGGAQGAAAAFAEAGCPEIRIVNRTRARAQALAERFAAHAFGLDEVASALAGANAVINTTSAGLSGETLDVPFDVTPAACVAMDMTYKPLRTPFLQAAETAGRRTVDGLAMLIGQAIPSFEAFFGQRPPAQVDVRGLAIQTLGL